VDVGSAYIGITSFNPWIVGTLLAVSTFSGPILWMLLFACKYESLILEEATSMSSFRSNYASFLLSRGFEITLYLCISTLHRHHLFVWTVFSPKLLYLAMAVLTANIMHSLIIIIICQKRAKIYKSEI
jgi:ethanolaminephosphotransferase